MGWFSSKKAVKNPHNKGNPMILSLFMRIDINLNLKNKVEEGYESS